MNVNVSKEEAQLIVKALGTYEARRRQRRKWFLKKRLSSLRAKLADCVLIGDEKEAGVIRGLFAYPGKCIEVLAQREGGAKILKERIEKQLNESEETTEKENVA